MARNPGLCGIIKGGHHSSKSIGSPSFAEQIALALVPRGFVETLPLGSRERSCVRCILAQLRIFIPTSFGEYRFERPAHEKSRKLAGFPGRCPFCNGVTLGDQTQLESQNDPVV